MVGQLRYTCVETKDLKASKEFYVEKLGLKLQTEGDGWFTLDGSGSTILVWQGDRPTTLMGFVQPELEEARAALAARGVNPSEIQAHPDGQHFIVTDPDGNPIMIFNN